MSNNTYEHERLVETKNISTEGLERVREKEGEIESEKEGECVGVGICGTVLCYVGVE